jgi:5-methylcytosine-specific restriction endonuclease McrA
MGAEKKLIRKNFRDSCFKRDKYKCVMCHFKSSPDKAEQDLDAHHVYDRNLMPNGGYVKENGISLCAPCHEKAEVFHSTGTPVPGYSIEELYRAIGSTYEQAIKASEKLK